MKSETCKSENGDISSFQFWSIYLAFLILSIVVYYPIFTILPSCDDFVAPMAEILRGEKEGVGSFFTASQQGDYRPLQSLTMWSFGRFEQDKEQTYFWIHVLHIISYWLFCFVGFLWIRLCKLNIYGTIISAFVLFFHPLLASAVGSIDGFGRILVYTFLWLGAYFLIVYIKDNLLKATFLVTLCFIVAIGYMEYAVTLIPVALGIAFTLSRSERFKSSLTVIIPMVIVFLAYYLIRMLIVDKTMGGSEFITAVPSDWIKNFIMIYSSLTYFGNTTPIMLEMNMKNLAWFGVNSLIVILTVLSGYILFINQTISNKESIKTPIIVLILCILSIFPVVFMDHISELYVIGMVLVFALLAGYSATGWYRSSHILKYLMAGIFIFQITIGLFAIQSKITDLKNMGIRTQNQINSILKHISTDSKNLNIAIVFTPPALDKTQRYSNFARDDAYVIHKDQGTFTLNWYLPDRNHTLAHELVDDFSEVDMGQYDMVLIWDFDSKIFHKIK